MECQQARLIFSEPTAGDLVDARIHVRDCPACQAVVAQYVRAIQSGGEEITCAECRSRLPSYQLGEDDAAVTYHLATCPLCSEVYTSLVDLVAVWGTEGVSIIESAPSLDLSFLPESAGPSRWHDSRADRTRELAETICITLGEVAARFGTLPEWLIPRPVGRDLFRDAGAPGPEAVTLPAPTSDLQIQLTVGPLINGLAALAVTIERTADGEPQAGSRVMLYLADGALLAGQETDRSGSVIFQGVGRGTYRLQLRQGEQRWELLILVE